MGWIWIWSWTNYPALLEIEDTNAKKRTNLSTNGQLIASKTLSLFLSPSCTPHRGKKQTYTNLFATSLPKSLIYYPFPFAYSVSFRAVFSAPSGFRLRAYLPASSLYMCNMFAYAL